MQDLLTARTLHVLAVLLWIGGVAFVTLVLLPGVRRGADPREGLAWFHRLERPFAWQARLWTVLAGASGFYLTARLDLWWRFLDARFLWMHAMVGLWALFTLMLFVLEPLWLHAWFEARARRDPAGTLALVTRLHRVLLALSLATVALATAGSHGLLLSLPWTTP